MDIWETNKLVLFLAFVIPGFISIKIYDLLAPSNKIDSSKIIIDAIAYSSINYAFLSIPIYLVEQNKINQTHEHLYLIFYFFVLFISPILLALFWKWLRGRDFIQNNLPHPIAKPWDYIFSQRKSFWVKVTLKNGNVIGGKYSEKSFASSTPSKEQIYLEETWIINDKGGFERKKERSNGIIVMSDEISHIELVEYIIKEDDEQKNCNESKTN